MPSIPISSILIDFKFNLVARCKTKSRRKEITLNESCFFNSLRVGEKETGEKLCVFRVLPSIVPIDYCKIKIPSSPSLWYVLLNTLPPSWRKIVFKINVLLWVFLSDKAGRVSHTFLQISLNTMIPKWLFHGKLFSHLLLAFWMLQLGPFLMRVAAIFWGFIANMNSCKTMMGDRVRDIFALAHI